MHQPVEAKVVYKVKIGGDEEFVFAENFEKYYKDKKFSEDQKSKLEVFQTTMSDWFMHSVIGSNVYFRSPNNYVWTKKELSSLVLQRSLDIVGKLSAWFKLEPETIQNNAFLKDILAILEEKNFFSLSLEEKFNFLMEERLNPVFMSAMLKDWQMAEGFIKKVIGNDSSKLSEIKVTRYIQIFDLNKLRRQCIPDASMRKQIPISQQQALVLEAIRQYKDKKKAQTPFVPPPEGELTVYITQLDMKQGNIIPEELVCTLSGGLFKDPVKLIEKDSQGKEHTFYFERAYIERSLGVKQVNPLTRNPATLAELKEAPEKKAEVDNFKEEFKQKMFNNQNEAKNSDEEKKKSEEQEEQLGEKPFENDNTKKIDLSETLAACKNLPDELKNIIQEKKVISKELIKMIDQMFGSLDTQIRRFDGYLNEYSNQRQSDKILTFWSRSFYHRENGVKQAQAWRKSWSDYHINENKVTPYAYFYENVEILINTPYYSQSQLILSDAYEESLKRLNNKAIELLEKYPGNTRRHSAKSYILTYIKETEQMITDSKKIINNKDKPYSVNDSILNMADDSVRKAEINKYTRNAP